MSLHKLHPQLQKLIKDSKWTDLTPIQKLAFDPIFRGDSCTIEAPTSGGKTEAVLFPLLTRLASSKTTGFKILYIAPLKALLNDLDKRISPYARKCYREAFKWHGDVSQAEKIQQMSFPADILLTTPESLEAILLRKPNWKEVFQQLETIVIDEAHYFAQTERGAHLVSLLSRMQAENKKDTQRIAMTATVGNPDALLKWLMNHQMGGYPIKATSNREKGKDFCIEYFFNDGLGLHERVYSLLVNKKSIVFERSRKRTEELASIINERNYTASSRIPVKVKTHHSSVSKQLREAAEKSISLTTESSLNAIISTSTLELGIDIGDLDQVIQMEGLNSSGSFLQRVGRTGRRSDRPQFFRGLCTEPDQLVLLTGCVSLGCKGVSENIILPQKSFHILSHQIICLCLQKMGVTADQCWDILSKASCFAQITRKEFDELIQYMMKEEYLRRVEHEVLLIGTQAEEEFLHSNWKKLFAIFDTGPMYNVVDGKKVIGTLDSDFARAQELPFIFVLGGQEWNAIKIDHTMQQVLVEKNKSGLAPKWRAIGNYDIPFELAQEVGLLLMSRDELPFLDNNAAMVFQSQRDMYSEIQWDTGEWVVGGIEENSVFHIWTFAGDKINRVLALLLEKRLGTKTSYTYMNVIVEASNEKPVNVLDIKRMISVLTAMDEIAISEIIDQKIKVSWFSKFSKCLPENLAKTVIREKGYDVKGFLKELRFINERGKMAQ